MRNYFFKYGPLQQPKSVNRFVIGISITMLLLLFSVIVFSQNTGINPTGSAPNASAMLDIDVSAFAANNKKGLLIPRMTTADRNAIPTPAAGLLIYNTTTNLINFYNGTFWRTFNDALSSATVAGGAGTGPGIAINTINADPHSSAMLDVSSATRGFLPPRTTAASIATPVAGLLIYSTATNRISFYDGTAWQVPCDEGSSAASAGSQPSVGVAINTSGADAHYSAMLDVSSTSMGFLLPRITAAERDALPSPAQGLIIYNSTGNRIEFFNSTQWQRVMYSVPTAVTASAAPNPICEGSTLTLTGGATDATIWSWTGPNGFTSALQSPSISGITTSGAGIYTLTASNSCGSAAAVNTASVTVYLYWNTAQSASNYQRNDCGACQTGSWPTYTVSANTYSSCVSQADANAQAQSAATAANTQAWANANGTCSGTQYWNTAQSASNYQKNDCGACQTGSWPTYTVGANLYSSCISQADANAQAQSAATAANTQAWANANGTCSGTQYWNTVQSGNFTRNNCGACQTGSTVTYTVNANTYSSCTSQADANTLATDDVSANGQAYANANGTCSGTQYWNTAQSASNYQRNDCGACQTGSWPTYTVSANTYSSCVSQADANAQAQSAATAGNTQAWANANGTCSGTQYWNTVQSGNFTRNNCGACQTGSTVTYTVSANTYSSCTSQAAANTLATDDVSANGQAYANTNGTCSGTQYWNTAQSASNYQRNDCGACQTGSWPTYTVSANTYSSCVSQADANAQAQSAATAGNTQAWANANGTCSGTQYWNTVQSGNFTRNNCGACQTGSTVTYTVSANTYSSCTSQAAANTLATDDVSANGQAYANANGTCSGTQYWNTAQSASNYQRNDCGACQTGSWPTYTVGAGTYSSCVSQADANSQALNAATTANTQAWANANGTCSGTQYWNTVQSGNFTRNNCGACQTGSTVTYTVSANTYSSCTSQAAANTLATDDVSTNGQAYANANGTCSGTQYWNTAQSASNYQRNNCGACQTGSWPTYTVSANTYSSCVSQADANAQAQSAATAGNTQAWANANGTCSGTQYWNTVQSGNFTRNNCGACQTGSTVTYTVSANTYSSCTSQAAANTLATDDVSANGQAYANANGTCSGTQYWNTAQSASNYQRNDCGACQTGSWPTYTVSANTYSSCVSQADANSQAQTAATTANTQAWANANGTCSGTQYWNTAQSASNYQKNDCGACQTGSWPTYTVSANTYSSCVSQADANAQAQSAATAANTQAWANANGTCSGTQYWNTAQSASNYQRNDCGACQTGSWPIYTVGAGTYSSCVSQADANSQALNAATTANTQAWANANGTCTVTSFPPAAPTASATSITCASYTATWTASSGATYYLLDLGNDCDGWTTTNFNVGNTTNYSYSTPNPSCDYYFRVRAANACGASGYSNTVSVVPPCCTPPAAVTVSGGGTFCNSTTLTASGGAGGTIYWQGTTSNGTSLATPSTSQVVSSSGTYYFRSYNSAGGGCWGPQGSATVTINTIPATPGAISGPTTVSPATCGIAYRYDYSILPVSGATSYLWTSTRPTWTEYNCMCDDSPCVCGTGVKICWGTTGSYNLCVAAQNACGTSAPSCITVNKTTASCFCP